MSNTDGDATLADKAFDVAGKAAKGVASGFKKATNAAADKSEISAASGSTLIKIMRYGDIVLGVLLILCYPIDMITGSIQMNTTTIFMMVYCILFSVMLIYFEMGLGKYEEFIRKYFGFMYSYMGRTIFTLFAVAMVFGRGKGKSLPLLNIIIGIIGIVLCIFNCFVVCKHPSFQKGGEFYSNGAEAASEPVAKKQTESKKEKKAPAYEANPFESSSDDDIPAASVPGEKKSKKARASNKKREENPFEDDNPFDD
ncbi:hypothetical protein JH06_1592 [Blastocystis sp. subtype 4]|uniref:hypothetical protein n=1 Tax=Blastocystis sp. subtype 4 TaxID=944170 RepID=UPI000711FE9E|nr:hypothetical protein JH06_1592 [Blastocystis sp. subtype 4]KNB44870.1 hypothetical protein JH06_1592 [Blastocystis sp. subtype 4]|eukprot:XP_014528313.1 hypothetical protein JH06_1592 [Blastocystis sp. subtype 4]